MSIHVSYSFLGRSASPMFNPGLGSPKEEGHFRLYGHDNQGCGGIHRLAVMTAVLSLQVAFPSSYTYKLSGVASAGIAPRSASIPRLRGLSDGALLYCT